MDGVGDPSTRPIPVNPTSYPYPTQTDPVPGYPLCVVYGMGITGCRVHWYLLLEYSHSNPVTVGRGVGVPSGLLCTLRVLNIQEANHQQILKDTYPGYPLPLLPR